MLEAKKTVAASAFYKSLLEALTICSEPDSRHAGPDGTFVTYTRSACPVELLNYMLSWCSSGVTWPHVVCGAYLYVCADVPT